jgi:riboflavin kinase/FMN adenylyltransferase
VYVSRATVRNQDYLAATNVGIRPTFQGRKLTVEAHLLDFTGDLYGDRMELHFLQKLREEMRFTGPDELKTQIHADIQEARNYWIK